MRIFSIAPILVLIALLVAPASAQQGNEAPVEYPTVAALQNTFIPPRDRVALAQELLGVGEIAPPPTSALTRQIGEQATFNVTDSGSDASFQVEATLRAIGDHIYLYVENGAAIDNEAIKDLAIGFDERVYDNVRDLWGSEDTPGIDGDPRVYGLFTRGLGANTAAYFVSEHVYPVEAVSTSNEHEMFFFNLDSLMFGFDPVETESIIAHEFQHMIRNNLQLNEENWINEGFSLFTQVHFYNPPISLILSFLNAPGTQLNTWAEQSGMRAANYGAATLFTTYFYDRYGQDALRQLSADPSNRALDGVDNVLRSLGEPGVNEFFADWVLANFIADPSIGDGRYGYPSLGSDTVSALPLETVTQYPLERTGTVNQYATDYYVLTNLDDARTLNVSLDSPSTVALVPVSAYSGQRMWYSNKSDMSRTTLTREFDLSGVESATLNFMLWYQLENVWDYGYLMASGDGGETWDILPTTHTTDENPHNLAYGPGYTGGSGGWVEESVSLDNYVGDNVLIRFQMITDDAVTQPGLAIDNVAIPEIGYSDDFESGEGDWQAEGWIWTDNVLPQQVWVQAVQQIGSEVEVTRWLGPMDFSADASWQLPLIEGVDQVVLAVSPFAPVTTVPMPYTLSVSTSTTPVGELVALPASGG